MTTVTLENLQLTDNKTIKEWLERFEALCILTKVTEEYKVSALIANLGSIAYSIVAEGVAPKTVAETNYFDIKNILLSYKSVDTLISVARYKFSKIEQGVDEDILTLFNRLNAASVGCKFDKYKDERLRDQLVCSLINKELVQVVLQIKNEDYTKIKAKELVHKLQGIEAIKIGMKDMTNEKTYVQTNEKRDQFKNNYIKFCTRCGGSHKIRQCPAFGKNVKFVT